jgi:hypothetical protein
MNIPMPETVVWIRAVRMTPSATARIAWPARMTAA